MAAALTAWRSNLLTSFSANQNRRFLATIVKKALEAVALFRECLPITVTVMDGLILYKCYTCFKFQENDA